MKIISKEQRKYKEVSPKTENNDNNNESLQDKFLAMMSTYNNSRWNISLDGDMRARMKCHVFFFYYSYYSVCLF